jgi:recombinational DNA repair protein RecT
MADTFLALLEKEAESIKAMLPSKEDKDRWWALAYEMTKRPELRDVATKNPASLLNAIKKCADWGLVPDGDECFINVYSGVAEAQPMYKGMIRRAVEAGAIAHCVADLIRAGDTIEESIGRHGRVFKHTRANGPKNRALTGAYAVFWLPNGLMDYELFDAEDIERCREAARRNKGGKDSPAYVAFPGEMAKKSVLRRGLKRMRGRREDSSYNRMVTAETQFDREVEGTELPADDLPTAREDTAAPIQVGETAQKPKAKPLALTPEVMPKNTVRKLSAQEQQDLIDQGKALGLRRSDVINVLEEEFDPPCPLEERTTDQIPALSMALQQRAMELGVGNDLNDAASAQDRLAHGERVR